MKRLMNLYKYNKIILKIQPKIKIYLRKTHPLKIYVNRMMRFKLLKIFK